MADHQASPAQRAQPEPLVMVQPEPQEQVQPEPQEQVQPEPQQQIQPEPQEQMQPEPQEQMQPQPKEMLQQRVSVLLYHDLRPGANGENGAVISVEDFESQMDWLKRNGYSTITTADLFDWLNIGKELPPKAVLITFDDGYRSNYVHAYPILKRYGFKAVIFMVTSYAGKRIGDLDYISWAEMKEMEQSGVIEIQSHTHDGHRLVEGKPALIAWSADEIHTDLEESAHEKALNGLQPITAYAYPYGAYDSEAIETLKAAGVQLAFTVERGSVGKDANPYTLHREVVFPGIGTCRFAKLVTAGSDTAPSACDR